MQVAAASGCLGLAFLTEYGSRQSAPRRGEPTAAAGSQAQARRRPKAGGAGTGARRASSRVGSGGLASGEDLQLHLHQVHLVGHRFQYCEVLTQIDGVRFIKKDSGNIAAAK